MELVVRPTGEITTIYSEVMDLEALGAQRIERASQVEPDQHGRWFAQISTEEWKPVSTMEEMAVDICESESAEWNLGADRNQSPTPSMWFDEVSMSAVPLGLILSSYVLAGLISERLGPASWTWIIVALPIALILQLFCLRTLRWPSYLIIPAMILACLPWMGYLPLLLAGVHTGFRTLSLIRQSQDVA